MRFISIVSAAMWMAAPSALADYVQQGSWHQTQKVFALAQTPDGFVWAATDSGLLRYDGQRWKTFSTDATSGRSNIVRALNVGDDGRLWIGLEEGNGLALFDGVKIVPLDAGSALRKVEIYALGAHRDRVLIGSSQGLFSYDHSHPGTAVHVNAVGVQTIHAIENGGAEVSWIGTASGLWRWEGEQPQRVGNFGPVLALAEDSKDGVWVSDGNAGVSHWSVATGNRPVISITGLEQGGAGFTALTRDRRGDLWVGWNWGYGRIRGADLSPRFSTGLPTVSLLPDNEGGMWTGTYWGVVFRNFEPRISTHTFSGPGELPIIFGLGEAVDGSIWLAQQRSLVHVTGTEALRLECGRDLPFWCPRSVWPSKAGGVWVATCDKGVFYLNGKTAVGISPPNEPKLANIQTVLETREGDVLLGSALGDLYRRRGERLERLPLTNGACGPDAPPIIRKTPRIDDECGYSITAMAPARAGGYWIATRRNGLRRIWDGGEEIFTKENGLPTNDLIALFEDEEAILWIGTQAHGLIRYGNGHFDVLDRAAGLPSQSIHGITEDKHRRLWMSSESGVLRIEKSSLQAYLNKETTTLSVAAYGVSDGLASPITVQSFSSPIAFTADERLLVPLDKGLAIIDVRRIDSTNGFAAVVIESVRVNGEAHPVQEAVKLDLPVSTNRLASLEFGLSLPNFDVPQRATIAYRLEPLETSFKLAGTDRTIRYLDLPPGRYTFVVKPWLDGATWGHVERSHAVYLRSFYARPVFFMFVAALTLPLFGLYYIVRLRYQRARFNTVLNERNRIARELHDTLAQYFTGISYQLARLSMALKADDKEAAEINEVTKMMLAQCRLETRQAIHNLRRDEQQGILESLKVLADDTRISADVNVEFHASGIDRVIADSVHDQVMRIVQEATVNAVTHAQCSCIKLSAALRADGLTLSIVDDGEGFDIEAMRTGKPLHFGLQGLSERANAINANLHIDSKIAEGTSIALDVPLRS